MSSELPAFGGVASALLVSMPQMTDPNFHQTVILLCEHGADGAFGLVLNRPTETSAASVVRLAPPVEIDNGLELWIGGPVEPERGWILTGTTRWCRGMIGNNGMTTVESSSRTGAGPMRIRYRPARLS